MSELVEEKVEMKDLVKLVIIAVANNEVSGLSFLLKQIVDLHEEVKAEVVRLDSELNASVMSRTNLVNNLTRVLNRELPGIEYSDRKIPDGIGVELVQLASLGMPDISQVDLSSVDKAQFAKAAEDFRKAETSSDNTMVS